MMGHTTNTEIQTSALSISFGMGGLSLPDTTKKIHDLRGISLRVDNNLIDTSTNLAGHDVTQKFDSEGKPIIHFNSFPETTQNFIAEAWQLATTPIQNFINAKFIEFYSTYFTESQRGNKTFTLDTKKHFFTYSADIDFTTFNAMGEPQKVTSGKLVITGNIHKGIIRHAGKLRATLSLTYETNEQKKALEQTLKNFSDCYFNDSEIYNRKLKVNLFRRLTAAFLLNAAAVTPILIFILIPLFIGMGLPMLAIAGIGAGISLAGLGIMFGINTGVYALFYKLVKEHPQVVETEIMLSPPDDLKKESISTPSHSTRTQGDEPVIFMERRSRRQSGAPSLSFTGAHYQESPTTFLNRSSSEDPRVVVVLETENTDDEEQTPTRNARSSRR